MRYAILFISACAISLLVAYYALNPGEVSDLKSATEFTPLVRDGERYTFSLENSDITLIKSVTALSGPPIKVGFIFFGESGDYGFTYAHNQARLALDEQLGVETVVMDGVRSDEESLQAFERLVTAGCKIIFSCSSRFMEHAVLMAEKYPDVYFLNCAGTELRHNLSEFFGRMYQVRYLTGIVAGLRTMTDRVGYVAAFPNPEVVRGLNAFALGVKSVNPRAKVHLRWSYVWYEPGRERECALALLDQGCDVIAQHQDSVAPQVAAEERGVWSIGYHSSMEFFAKNAYLTGASWNWAPFIIKQVRMAQNGTWAASCYWGGIEDDVVRLDPLTANVAPGTEEAVAKAAAAIKNGFDVFVGPLYDNTGVLRVPHGHTMTDEEKLSMLWLADTVVESVE